VNTVMEALAGEGAVVRLLAARLGVVRGEDGVVLEPDGTFETMPSVLFDAVVVPDGEDAAAELESLGQVLEFLKDQYRHCKAILMLGDAAQGVVAAAGIPVEEDDAAIVRELEDFVAAVGRHRNWDRQVDPPRV